MVYVLIEEWEREGFRLIGVFSTLELAQNEPPKGWAQHKDRNYYGYIDSGTRRIIYPVEIDQKVE